MPDSRTSPRNSPQVRRSVLLWAGVTIALWAGLPLAMYLSHWQWFGWMPRVGPPPPPPGAVMPPHPHGGPPDMVLTMASFLVMSSVLMAVVLWMVSLRPHNSHSQK